MASKRRNMFYKNKKQETTEIVETMEEVDLHIPASESVRVIDAYKCFTENHLVLNGFNMSVSRGSIYGLLGPSGCGKTTLLRCLVGSSRLDHGEIRLSAKSRKDIGYMLQEIALSVELSIKETFEFFGRLFNIRSSEVKDKRRELNKLLQLPDNHMIVSEMSWGQQRRLSFAVCLLHDPQLLILDEPTVGLDPLLRETLWEHLSILSKRGKTVLITTHYIEEARQAHLVGLMRGGKLLAEDVPDAVMRQMNCPSLEEAFLQLCYSHQHELQSSQTIQEEQQINIGKKGKVRDHLAKEPIFTVYRFWAQFMRQMIWMKRNPYIILFLLLLPTACTYLSQELYLRPPLRTRLGVINSEVSPSVCAEQPFMEKPVCSNNTNFLLSCWWFAAESANSSTSMITLEWINSFEQGKKMVDNGLLWGYIYFPENYTESFKERINYARFVSDDVIESGLANVWLDMSNSVKGPLLLRYFYESFKTLTRKMTVACGAPEKAGEIPIRFEDAVYMTNEPNHAYSGQPAMFLTFAFYLSVIYTTTAIMIDRGNMLMDRNLSAGMSFTEIVVAQTSIQYIVNCIQIIIMLISNYPIYHNPIQGSFLALIVIILLVHALGISYGFMLSLLFEADRIVAFAVVGTVVTLLTNSSLIWPLEGTHWVLRKMNWAFPVVPAVESYKSVALRGWSVFNPAVIYGLWQTVVWIIIFSLLSALFFRHSRLAK